MALRVPVPDGLVITCVPSSSFSTGSDFGRPSTARSRASATAAHQPRCRPRPARPFAGDGRSGARSNSAECCARPFVHWGRARSRCGARPLARTARASSFAGQFDSILHVDEDSLLDAVRACWASYWSARALAYRRAHGLTTAAMAVVVQRQVDAAAAGVLFTRNPDPGSINAADMVVEYGSGLADRLVAGEVDPGRLYLSRASLTVTDETPLPEHADARRVLTAPLLRQLGATVLRLEEAFRSPQDIEWAVSVDGRLALSRRGRSRPAATRRPCRPCLWINANVSENFPEPISPLLYSIAVGRLLPLLPQPRPRVRRVAAPARRDGRAAAHHHRRARRAHVLQPHEHPRGAADGAVRRAAGRGVQRIRRRPTNRGAAGRQPQLARCARIR